MAKQGVVVEWGYTGHKIGELEALLKQHAPCMLFDVRFSPRSRNPVWIGARMKEHFGKLYYHAMGFGNLNYRGGPIQLCNPTTEIANVRKCLEHGKTVILMCACPDYNQCHRKVVAELLQSKLRCQVILTGEEEEDEEEPDLFTETEQ